MVKILVSAGHYPARPGARMGDFVEHFEAVTWRDLLVAELGDIAAPVPVGVLREKVAHINAAGATLAVEIHFNDAWRDRNGDGTVDDGEHVGRGSETLYYPGSDEGLALAEAVQAELSAVFPPNRGAKEGWYRMDPKFGPDFFLAKTRCPSVIIEPEFVANAETIRSNRSSGIAVVARAIRGYLAS